MARHPNAQVIYDYLAHVRQFLDDLEAGKVGPDGYKNKYLHDNLAARYPGRSDMAGYFEGPDFYKKFSARLGQYKTTLVEIVDVLASDDRAAVIAKEKLEADDGRFIETTRVAIYTIVNGQIKEMWVLDDDQYAMDEFLMATGKPIK